MADTMKGVAVRVKGTNEHFAGAEGTIREIDNAPGPMGEAQQPVYGVEGIREGMLSWFTASQIQRRKA